MNQPYKVLFITRRFPPSVGGMQRFAYDLSQALAQQTAQFDVVSWGGSNKWLPVVIPWLFVRAFCKLAMTRDYDLIHIQDGMLSPVGWLLRLMFHRPYIVVAHGLDVTFPPAVYQWFIPRFLRHANAVVSISKATAQEVTSRGVDDRHSYVIPLAIDDSFKMIQLDKDAITSIGIDVQPGDITLLTVGRLVKRKGVAWFIANVLPLVIEKHSNVKYLVVGEGAERPQIEQAIKNANLQKNVFLLGEVDEKTKLILYKNTDIFVMPNVKVHGDMEGFGIVAQEAATAGLPIIASNLEGIADAIDSGKNGILVQSENVDKYVKELTKFIVNKSLRKEFGTKARKYTLDNFGWNKIAEQYISVYTAIVNKK